MDKVFQGLGELAATQINIAGMLVLVIFVLSLSLLIWIWKKPASKPETTEHDTTKILAETLGGIIANELKKVAQDMKTDAATTSREHQIIVDALNKFAETQERTVQLITTHNEKTDVNRQIINETSKAVEIMNTDIEEIKSDLETMRNTLDNINKRINEGVPMNADSLEIMQQFVSCAKQLEDALKKATQEMKVVPPPKEPNPKPKPKIATPENTGKSQEKTE
jgi:methyl-accepting chemotaxis protein